MLDLKDFLNPPSTYRCVPFWSWNEVMEPAEIKRQIKLIKEGGWGGAFVHSRVGLITDYMSDQWFKAVDQTIETCKEEDLIVWLYDEDKWPSGFNGGTVPLKDPKFREKVLIARKVGQNPPKDCQKIASTQDGLDFYIWTAPLGDPWFNGTSSVDRCSKEAMGFFIKEAYQSYYDRYKDDYGSTIKAEFTDEPSPIFRTRIPEGAVAYSQDFFPTFQELNGYSCLEHLSKLFVDKDGSEKFRLDWYKTINYLFEQNYSKQMGDWCKEHNIDLTGHFMCEHGLLPQQNWGTQVMPNYRHQGLPGIDHLGRQIDERITGKQCQSVVNQYGKSRMLSELYGCCGGGMTFIDRKWIALEEICLGVNLLNPHLALYTMSGCRKRDFPQNIFYQQAWWDLNKYLDEPLARICYALSNGKYSTNILLLHPQKSVQAIWKSKIDQFKNEPDKLHLEQDWDNIDPKNKERVLDLEKKFFACLNQLLGSQVTFDLADETIMQDDASVNDDNFIIKNSSYKLLIVPPMITMCKNTFDLLKKYYANGGKIIKTQESPSKIDGEISQELIEFFANLPEVKIDDLGNSLREVYPQFLNLQSNFTGDKSLLWTHIRDLEDGSKIVFFVNLNRFKAFNGKFDLEKSFKYCYLLNDKNGQLEQLDAQLEEISQINLDIAQSGSQMILLSNKQISSAKKLDNNSSCEKILLPKAIFKQEILDENSLVLDYASFKIGNDEMSKGQVPVIEIQNFLNKSRYEGNLTLNYKFNVKNLKTNCLKLVIEHPERCSITVNGTSVKYDNLGFWRDIRWMKIDILPHIKEGENEIELFYENFTFGDLAIFENPASRYGTEIESLYLIGNFAVNSKDTNKKNYQSYFDTWQVPRPDLSSVSFDDLFITSDKQLSYGDITFQGYPFYAGRVALKAKRSDLEKYIGQNKEIEIGFEDMNAAVAAIYLDDSKTPSGVYTAKPFNAKISTSFEEITIVFYTSLRNLLGPSHHYEGELIACGPDSFYSKEMPESLKEHFEKLNQWAKGEFTPSDWDKDYCSLLFGPVSEVYIKK